MGRGRGARLRRNELPANAKELGKVYNTYFIVRGDNAWARLHPEEAQRIFLLSERVLATQNSVTIPFMTGFLRDQFDPDYTNIERKKRIVLT